MASLCLPLKRAHDGASRAAFRLVFAGPSSVKEIHTAKRKPAVPNQQYLRQHATASTSHLDGGAVHEAMGRDPRQPPLSVLSLGVLLRGLIISTISSSPTLLPPSLAALRILAKSNSALLNPDKNLLLKFAIKPTLYAQFCAGENAPEVRRTITRLKNLGFNGVILGYAKEAVLSQDQLDARGGSAAEAASRDIESWKNGTLETVRLAEAGDFVALKFTGAGPQAFFDLVDNKAPAPALAAAIDEICGLAHARGVRLLLDAEQDAVQRGIDTWALHYMQKYNASSSKAVVYNTYQAYLKKTPDTLAAHIQAAQRHNFALGVKLVRGAYLGSDPRHIIHDTKAGTDQAYDDIASGILRRQWGPRVSGDGAFPPVSFVLASHNAHSVEKAKAIIETGEAKAEVACAQLQGMADEVSCTLLQRGEEKPCVNAYKYLVWGTTGECVKYLLRRAQENKDAVQRTRSGRDAMWAELIRRMKASVGLSA